MHHQAERSDGAFVERRAVDPRRGSSMTAVRPLLVLVLVSAFGSVARADAGWEHVKRRGAVSYERRAVAGSKFREYRATVTVAASEAATLEAIWGAVSTTPSPTVTERVVLRGSDTELLVHDRIDGSVASDREVTMRIEKLPHEVRFRSRNDLGPAPDPKRVLVPVVRGGWRLEPVAEGTRVIFECYSEPGGSIPAFLVRGAQQGQIQRDVERFLARLPGAGR